jgi:hypothetical protein
MNAAPSGGTCPLPLVAASMNALEPVRCNSNAGVAVGEGDGDGDSLCESAAVLEHAPRTVLSIAERHTIRTFTPTASYKIRV